MPCCWRCCCTLGRGEPPCWPRPATFWRPKVPQLLDNIADAESAQSEGAESCRADASAEQVHVLVLLELQFSCLIIVALLVSASVERGSQNFLCWHIGTVLCPC